MSFTAADLSVLGYANGFTHWHYRTADRLDQVLRPVAGANDNAYFAPAAEMLRPGDQITLNLMTPAGIELAHLAVTALPAQGPRLKLLASTSPDPTAAARAA